MRKQFIMMEVYKYPIPENVREIAIQDAIQFCAKHNALPNYKPYYRYSWHIEDDKLFVMCGPMLVYYIDLPPCKTKDNVI